ncbi:MAG TPA: hypothetical protein PLA90_04150 [Candidatus Sumerlaeota bacterium]|nr:hypothetical protein [Candidatus Sumerlaeota bacterium]
MNWVQCVLQSIKRKPLVWLLAAVGIVVVGPVVLHLFEGLFAVAMWGLRVLAFCVVLSIPMLVGYMLFQGLFGKPERESEPEPRPRESFTGPEPDRLARLKRRVAAMETILDEKFAEMRRKS